MAAASFLQFKLAAGKGPPPLSLLPLPHGIRCITSEFAQSPDSLLTNPKETKTKEEEKKKEEKEEYEEEVAVRSKHTNLFHSKVNGCASTVREGTRSVARWRRRERHEG